MHRFHRPRLVSLSYAIATLLANAWLFYEAHRSVKRKKATLSDELRRDELKALQSKVSALRKEMAAR